MRVQAFKSSGEKLGIPFELDDDYLDSMFRTPFVSEITFTMYDGSKVRYVKETDV